MRNVSTANKRKVKLGSETGGYRRYNMLLFLVVALVAALLGFWGIAGVAANIAKVLFVVFLVLFCVALLFGYAVI